VTHFRRIIGDVEQQLLKKHGSFNLSVFVRPTANPPPSKLGSALELLLLQPMRCCW